jgi:UDP-glucose 4-epimerase
MVDSPHRSILLTGSSGTIGTALGKRLLEAGYNVTGVDCRPNRWSNPLDERTTVLNLTDRPALDNVVNDIDLIIHLAANARVHHLVKNPDLAKENFDTTFNVLELARTTDADFIFSSSREVYGNNGKVIHNETDTYVDECESPYTASKIGGEALVKSYESCYGIDTNILRFSNVYGKYDASNRVIPLFIAQAMRGEDITVFGSDKILDFTYIDDCIHGIYSVVNQFNKGAGTTFNIASGHGTSILELAEFIVSETGEDVSINVEETRTGEVGRYVADVSKAQKILNYSPSWTVEEGLAETVDWYQSRPDLYDEILQ